MPCCPALIRELRAIVLAVAASLIVGACGGAAPSAMESSAVAPPTGGPGASTQPGAGSGTVDVSGPFTPVDLDVALDAARTTEMVVPVEGGVVSATGADGTTYTLEIPADALPEETTIGLTPAASIGGLPFGGDRAYAVQMSPDGLSLYNFATLTIVPAHALGPSEQVAFGYLGDGKDVIAAAMVADTPEIKIRVLHFSGAGVSNGGLPNTEEGFTTLGADAERRLEGEAYAAYQAERERALAGEDNDGTLAERIGAILDQYEEEVVKPRIAAAGESCDAGKAAVQSLLRLERNRQLLGLSQSDSNFMTQYVDVLNKTVRACVLEEFETCVEQHRFYLMLPLYFRVQRQQQLFPVLTPATLEEARDLTMKCLTFKLVLDSTANLNQAGWTHESKVTAEVILHFNPDENIQLIGGTADYVNTEYESHIPDCTIATSTGGGQIAVLGMIWVFELGARDSTGNYPNAGITDYEVTYSVGNSGEVMTLKCPDSAPVGPAPYPVWSLCYYDARANQIDTSGLKETKWDLEPPGNELLATKEWHLLGQADPNCTEEGTFELHHAPGA